LPKFLGPWWLSVVGHWFKSKAKQRLTAEKSERVKKADHAKAAWVKAKAKHPPHLLFAKVLSGLGLCVAMSAKY
jgi:hypothetical protein